MCTVTEIRIGDLLAERHLLPLVKTVFHLIVETGQRALIMDRWEIIKAYPNWI